MLLQTAVIYYQKLRCVKLAIAGLFDRLVARGKNKKLAVIAVCNKLLKQVFGVVKSGEMFDRNYLQKIA